MPVLISGRRHLVITGPAQSSSTAPYGGYVFSGPATGPAPQDFNKSPGIWQILYNDVAKAIGLPQVKADVKQPANGLVVRELDRQNNVYHAQQRGPVAHAEKLVSEARIPGIFSDSVDTPRLAAEIVALRRELPDLAPQIEREVIAKLGNAGDISRFAEDLRAAASHGATADQKLQSAAGAGVTNPPAPTRAQISADTNALITHATTYHFNGKLGTTTENFSVASIAAKVAERAETDPVGAQLVRADLTARLTPLEGAHLKRLLAGEAGFWENIAVVPYDPVDGSIGAAKSLANTGIDILNVIGRGEALRAAGEVEQAAAMQSLFGMDKAAAQTGQSAKILREAGQTDAIPSFEYKNAAQAGGANVATVAELAGGAKAVYSGSKWVLRSAPRLLAKGAAKQADELAEAAPVGRVTTIAFNRIDAIKEILAKVGGDFKSNPLRIEYEAKVADLKRYADRIPIGATNNDLKALAEAANAARRQLGVEYKNVTQAPLRDFIYDVNKARYEDPLGPTVEWLFDAGKSYKEIIHSASHPNPDVNTLLSKFESWLSKQPDSALVKYQKGLEN